MRIQVKNVSKSIRGRPILNDISFSIESGQSLAVIGPNGSGKSTLLRVMAGLLHADDGYVLIDKDRTNELSARMLAQRVGFVSQEAHTMDAIIVHDAVKLGRTPWLSFAAPFGAEDEYIVASAMHEMAIERFRTKRFNTLSEGEKQRGHIARARAQTPQIFLLDEPTNHLDIRHQITIIDWIMQQKSTVALALHDLNHAFSCDHVAVLNEGHVASFGTPHEVLVPDVLEPIFRVKVHQSSAEHLGHPVLTFSGCNTLS